MRSFGIVSWNFLVLTSINIPVNRFLVLFVIVKYIHCHIHIIIVMQCCENAKLTLFCSVKIYGRAFGGCIFVWKWRWIHEVKKINAWLFHSTLLFHWCTRESWHVCLKGWLNISQSVFNPFAIWAQAHVKSTLLILQLSHLYLGYPDL